MSSTEHLTEEQPPWQRIVTPFESRTDQTCSGFVNDEVEVEVLRVSSAAGRISVSLWAVALVYVEAN